MKFLNKVYEKIGFIFLAVFILPIFFAVIQSFGFKLELFKSFYLDFFFVVLQSFLSASFSIAIGVLIALSYLKKTSRWRKTLYWGLLPQALPTVLIVYAYFKIFSLFGLYPQSYIHVIIVHVLINLGLVAFLIFPHLQEETEKKLHLMVSLRLSKFQFFKLLLLGELSATLFYIWILVFSFSITSFSVPLLLSGSIPSSFDYLIYVKGYVQGDWASASLLGLIEFVFLGCLFFLKTQKLTLSSKQSNFAVLGDKKSYFHYVNFIPLILILISLLYFTSSNFSPAIQALKGDILEITLNTGFLAAWTLFFYSMFFWTQLYILKFEWVRKFHQFFWPLSPILLSFIILNFSLFFVDSLALKVAFSGLAISTFVFPIVFKFWILPEYSNIIYFNQKSNVMSLPYCKVFSLVIMPYFMSAYKTSLAYVVLFTIGDFTLSGILISDLKTMGISMRTYIQSYQLIEAQLLAIALIIISLVLIYIIGGKNNEYS